MGHRLDETGGDQEHQQDQAATSPVSGLAPDCEATAVREPLVLTGKPEKSPAARLAKPIPASS